MKYHMIWLLSLAFMVFITLTPSYAVTTEASAKEFIEDVSEEALNALAGIDDASEEEAKKQFRELLVKAFDMETISRFTLGRYWRQASKEQHAEFKNVLEDLIVRTYTKRLLDYQGNGFDIIGARNVSDKDVAVNMLIYPEGKKDKAIDLVWRVREINGQEKIIDLSVEGVSMSITHRTDFSSVIQRNGGQVQALIDSLKEKEALE